MGPQVKIGTHSVRRGTPSVPVAAAAAAAALAGGEPLSPSPTHPLLPQSSPPSIRPSHPLSSHSPALIYRAESPRNAPTPPRLPLLTLPPALTPTPFSPPLPPSFRPVTNSSLARPPRPALTPRLPSTPPISHPCALRLQSITPRRTHGGKFIKLSYICDDPAENKGYCFNCRPMTSNYAYQCVSLIFGGNGVSE